MNKPFEQEWISAYLDGELTSEEHQRVECRLAEDPELQQLHDDLVELRARLQGLPTVSPPVGHETAWTEQILRRALNAPTAADLPATEAVSGDDVAAVNDSAGSARSHSASDAESAPVDAAGRVGVARSIAQNHSQNWLIITVASLLLLLVGVLAVSQYPATPSGRPVSDARSPGDEAGQEEDEHAAIESSPERELREELPAAAGEAAPLAPNPRAPNSRAPRMSTSPPAESAQALRAETASADQGSGRPSMLVRDGAAESKNRERVSKTADRKPSVPDLKSSSAAEPSQADNQSSGPAGGSLARMQIQQPLPAPSQRAQSGSSDGQASEATRNGLGGAGFGGGGGLGGGATAAAGGGVASSPSGGRPESADNSAGRPQDKTRRFTAPANRADPALELLKERQLDRSLPAAEGSYLVEVALKAQAFDAEQWNRSLGRALRGDSGIQESRGRARGAARPESSDPRAPDQPGGNQVPNSQQEEVLQQEIRPKEQVRVSEARPRFTSQGTAAELERSLKTLLADSRLQLHALRMVDPRQLNSLAPSTTGQLGDAVSAAQRLAERSESVRPQSAIEIQEQLKQVAERLRLDRPRAGQDNASSLEARPKETRPEKTRSNPAADSSTQADSRNAGGLSASKKGQPSGVERAADMDESQAATSSQDDSSILTFYYWIVPSEDESQGQADAAPQQAVPSDKQD